MALSPYQFRPLTPPIAEEVPALIPGSHSRTVSDASSRSARSSPEYPDAFDYHPDTPLGSSPFFQSGGPVLIPQVRKQDLCPEPVTNFGGSKRHRRTSSASNCLFSPQSQPCRRYGSRATSTPPEVVNYDIQPNLDAGLSYNASAADFILGPCINPISQLQQHKPRGHSRSVSESTVSNASMGVFGSQPSYRTSYMSSLYIPPTITQTEFDFNTPVESTLSDPSFDFSDEILLAGVDEPIVSQLEYLVSQAPVVQICRQQPPPVGRNKKSQYWFDVRNLTEWEDFSLNTVLGMPVFSDLLSIPVSQRALTEPLILPSRTKPVDQNELKQLVREYYAAKVNAALRVSHGERRHMVMRPSQSHGGADFTSNYEMPSTKTIAGNGSRGRVIGLVKSFDTWNTGMRTSLNPNERCRYLEGLAHLHRCLREAECRYGFIITETELVCARYGTENTPLFGHLELTSSIRLNETVGLTACLALWYLHMLAGDEALPGQCGYRIHVGLPGELTRQNVLEEKDDWIAKLKIAEFEKREAKQTRGWADPTEKWNRKLEGGGTRRRR